MGAAGIALRVPTPNVSVVDLVIQTEKKTFAEEVNEAFRESSRGAQKVCIHEILSWLLLVCAMCAVIWYAMYRCTRCTKVKEHVTLVQVYNHFG